MALTVEQVFLTGRFHATRWNQNPFEDSHGEWPPSPYRFLRALAARWFELAREVNDRDEIARNGLLAEFAAADPPQYHLPANALHTVSWPARGLKQYQPLGLEKSDKKLGEPWMLRDTTTLVVDGFAILPADAKILWHWSTLDLPPERLTLLDNLLRRITYFGRAESLCLMRRRDPALPVPSPNCTLLRGAGTGSPVLAIDAAKPFDVSLLLAHNDDARLRGRRIPPGTCWLRAIRPPRPIGVPCPVTTRASRRRSVQQVQFAVGGRVFPPEKSWLQITERFRGLVLLRLREIVTGRSGVRANELTESERTAIRLMLGKEADGSLVRNHAHASFYLVPDQAGRPTRLFCYRREAFTQQEEDALLAACEVPLPWEYGNRDWLLRLVPLPPETPLPYARNIFATATHWCSLTLYVPSRHVFAANGKPKPGESV